MFRFYAEGSKLTIALLTGQKDAGAEAAALKRGSPTLACSLVEGVMGLNSGSPADVIVATPGRLMDHILTNAALPAEERYFR